MLPEFVNALATLKHTGSYELYSGPTKEGGHVVVTLESKRAEGYNTQYFKIKQVIVQPGQQAYVDKFDVSTIELAHKLILMSIEENKHANRGSNNTINDGIGKTNANNPSSSIPTPVKVVQPKYSHNNRIISATPIRVQPELPDEGSHDISEIMSGSSLSTGFAGTGIKIANFKEFQESPVSTGINNGQTAAEHRASIEDLLGGSL